MSENTEESRSERLRKRRSQQDTQPTDDSDTRADSPDTAPTTENSSTAETNVKDEQVGTYMYIPKTQKRELERLYNVLKANYEYEYDEPFEKNRHFYPLVVQYGLDGLSSLESSDIKTKLDSLE